MSNGISGDALRGHLATMLLAALESEPDHEFDLLKRLDELGQRLLRLQEGSVYPALYRPEQGGLIKGAGERESSRRGPRRRIYQLTRKGRAQLAAGRVEWRQFVSVVGGIVGA